MDDRDGHARRTRHAPGRDRPRHGRTDHRGARLRRPQGPARRSAAHPTPPRARGAAGAPPPPPPPAPVAVPPPATGALITEVPDSGAAEARAALDAAHAAFPAWRRTPAKQRAAIIKRWNDLVLAHQDDLGRLISREQGKPLAEGKGEVAYAASYIEWFAEEATDRKSTRLNSSHLV